MLGSARTKIDVPIAKPGAAVEMAEHDPERQRDQQRDAERGARELELLDRLREEKLRVVDDEAQRLDERVRVGGVADHRAAALDQGVTSRRAATSAPSQRSASATASAPAE